MVEKDVEIVNVLLHSMYAVVVVTNVQVVFLTIISVELYEDDETVVDPVCFLIEEVVDKVSMVMQDLNASI